MKEKILVTPRSFGKTNPQPIQLLEEAGYEVIMNPLGRIMNREEMAEHVKGVVGIINGIDPIDSTVLAAADKLRAISKYGVGTDNIDLKAAEEGGIPVAIAAGANTDAVADFAFTLMMACARRLVVINNRCKERDWTKLNALDVYGKHLGILGMGSIGKGLVKRASGFDMKISAYDMYWDETFAKKHQVSFAEPDEIYRNCDFISLHLPLTDDTRGMISTPQFDMMKPTAILVNTARGGIVDEEALVLALSEGSIYAAGFDAFQNEPPENDALYELENLIMGSHCAASTEGGTLSMGLVSANNLIELLAKTKS